jgi:hypothetical protein
MFSPSECGGGNDYHLAGLRHRYRDAAHNLVEQKLRSNRRRPIPYEEAWQIACRFPLIWESDLHHWIKSEWCDKITLLGMKPNQRVPKCQWGNSLV